MIKNSKYKMIKCGWIEKQKDISYIDKSTLR